MKIPVACLALATLVITPAAYARRNRTDAWEVVQATDPITRASTCAVIATDYMGRTRFTQTGGLYPVVEMNSTHGLLVGVSSGGRIRLPTGDILWVVDDRPQRTIRAADNPSENSALPGQPGLGASIEKMTAYAMQLSRQMTATSTMASGDTAREMLDEMLEGTSLLFRSAGSGVKTGLPDYSALVAGQVNERGELRPVPLDQSFRDGLRTCGIDAD